MTDRMGNCFPSVRSLAPWEAAPIVARFPSGQSMRLAVAVATIIASLAAASAGEMDERLDTGWWIVIASLGTSPAAMLKDSQRIEATAKRCGLQPFNDFSEKFGGFAPGFNVFVLGAFRGEDEARRVAGQAQPCFPNAYIKFGRYAGE